MVFVELISENENKKNKIHVLITIFSSFEVMYDNSAELPPWKQCEYE